MPRTSPSTLHVSLCNIPILWIGNFPKETHWGRGRARTQKDAFWLHHSLLGPSRTCLWAFHLTVSCLLAGLLWWLSSNQYTCNTGDHVQSLEEEMATHSRIPTWKIPWTEDGLKSMGSQRVRHNWAHTHIGLPQSKMKATSSTSGKFQLLLISVFRQGLNTVGMWPVWSIIWLTLLHSENSLIC